MAAITPNNETAMPVSPYPTFPRKREKGQTYRCASFTLKQGLWLMVSGYCRYMRDPAKHKVQQIIAWPII